MMIDSGVHEVSGADLPGVLDEAARRGIPVFTLSTGGRTDVETFFAAVRKALPLDPPLGTFRLVWDGLADSVRGGLHELDTPRVVIVWPDARPFADAREPDDFWVELGIFRQVVRSLAEPRYTGGRPTRVSVFIAPAPSDQEGTTP
jgi:hypothetical protein